MTEHNTPSLDQIRKVMKTATLLIETAETNLQKAKSLLSNIDSLWNHIGDLDAMSKEIKANSRQIEQESQDGQIIYGTFDGYFMLGEDLKKYPVPLNYSSKSKLVPGDKLKLTITSVGQLLYKLVWPCERKHTRAILSKDEEDGSKFIAITTDGESFGLNQAAVTFFKWRAWDEIYIITNKEWSWRYAAIEAVIKH